MRTCWKTAIVIQRLLDSPRDLGLPSIKDGKGRGTAFAIDSKGVVRRYREGFLGFPHSRNQLNMATMKTTALSKYRLRLAISFGVLASGIASAQISTTTVVDEASFVNTGGLLVSAANFGEEEVVVNGLVHGAGSASGNNLTTNISFEGDFRNGQTALGGALETLFSGIGGAGTLNLTVSGLDTGTEYLFQAYWEANPANTLDATIEGDNLAPIADQPTGVIVSYTLTPADGELNASFDVTGENAWLSGYSIQETTPSNPLLVETYPADDAPDMLATPNLVATFDVTPKVGTGNITIYNSNDTIFEQIPIGDARITFSGTDVIINPTADLVPGNDYYVLIDDTAITGVTGLPYAGIPSDKTEWNFSVISLGTLGCQLGVLDLAANGGINPATGVNWQEGDKYRLIFLTSTGTNAVSADITTYNDFVQGIAASSTAFPKLDYSLWKIVGSTVAVDARDNTGTNPGSGTGVAVFLTDGSSAIATSNADLWDNSIAFPVNLDENAVNASTSPNRVFTGSFATGTAVPISTTGDNPLGVPGGQGVQTGSSNVTGTGWIRSWKENINNVVQVYALSEPLTVVDTSDTTLPTLASIVDDKGGTSVEAGQSVLYTVTFDKPMSAGTVDVSDFENQLAAPVSIDSVSPTADPAVYEVSVGTSVTGSLLLQIKAGAVLADLPGNFLDTTSALPDTETLTITPDVTAPNLVSITDNVSGGPIVATKTGTPVYTVAFDEAMDPGSVGTDDFENASSAPLAIVSANPTGDPAVFEVAVTTSGPGDLVLQIKAGASITDAAGNPLDTGTALPDDTTITVDPAPELGGELGVLDVVNANGGINPATGVAWAEGDTYRLVFLTSQTTVATSADITSYNAFVQGVAAASTTFPDLGNGTWKIVGSTTAIDARDNTGTNPGSGTGVAVILMDGTTVIANNNTDLWNGINSPVTLNENGVPDSDDRAFTGTLGNGTKVTGTGDQPLGSFGTGLGNIRTGNSAVGGTGWMTNFNNPHTTPNKVFAMSEPLTVQSTVVSNPYDLWAAGPFPSTLPLTDPDPEIDFDGGGLDTGIEWVVGGDPTDGADDSSVAPTVDADSDPTYLLYTYRLSDAAAADVNTTVKVEYGSDLSGWNNNIDDGVADGVITDPPVDVPSEDYSLVTVKIPKSLEVGGKLFARLAVAVTSP